MSSVLLIDGYNLLWAANITADGPAASTLAGSRLRLLSFLLQFLPEAESVRTTVVFDAAQAPPGLPRRTHFRGVQIFFASDHDDADAMLEELIADHPAPRRLTVVSSDHRVQNAARRRRAKAIDSDVWFRSAAARSRRAAPASPKPNEPISSGEAEAWLAQFHLDGVLEETVDLPAIHRRSVVPSPPPSQKQIAHGKRPAAPLSDEELAEAFAQPGPSVNRPRRPTPRPRPSSAPAAPIPKPSRIAEAPAGEPRAAESKADLFDASALAEAEAIAEGREPVSRSARKRPIPAKRPATADADAAPCGKTIESAASKSPASPAKNVAPRKPDPKVGKKTRRAPPVLDDDSAGLTAGFNPFPPGYADDLVEKPEPRDGRA